MISRHISKAFILITFLNGTAKARETCITSTEGTRKIESERKFKSPSPSHPGNLEVMFRPIKLSQLSLLHSLL